MLRKQKFLLGVVLVAAIAVAAYAFRSPKEQEMAGVYVQTDDIPVTHLVLHSNGSFSDYSERPEKTGKWQLIDKEYFDGPSLLLIGGEGSDSYADQYLLTRHRGHVCIESEGDDGDVSTYWCRKISAAGQ